MADEFDLDQLDTDLEKENKVEKRIKDLSEKVRLTSEERDEKEKLLKESGDKIVGLEKERDFFSSFGDSVAKYPQASEFKDAIKEKVLHGYSVEDATVSVLAKEGKLETKAPASPPPLPRENPAGGSAINQPIVGGQKPVNQMTRDEKRAALVEAEARGDLGVN